MSNTKHTPGPWMVGHFNDVRTGDGYRSLANVSSSFELPAEANARLIAAAPELLDICESILAEVDYEGLQLESGRVAKLRAVIAKATAQ